MNAPRESFGYWRIRIMYSTMIGAAGLGSLLFLSLFHVQPRRSQPAPAS